MNLLDRIIDRANYYFYHVKRSVSIASRFVALIALAAMLTNVIPTLAEESEPLTSVVENVEEPQMESNDPPAPVVEDDVVKTDNPETNEDSLDQLPPEEEVAEEEEEEKIEVAESQPRITFRFPNSVAHDPRATVAFLPTLGMSGGGTGLLCISFNGVIDIATKNLVNNSKEGSLQVSGDLSSRVLVSGDFNQITQFLNSAGGVKLISPSGKLSWSSVSFGYVELTGVEVNPEFCGAAASSKAIGFRALGLQMDNVKTQVDFNKPSGK